MVKRISSSSPPPSSEDTKPSSSSINEIEPSPKNKNDKPSSPKKPKVTTTTSSSNKESWDLEKKKIVVEMITEAGINAVDYQVMSERTGLTMQQLKNSLKLRNDGRTNIRYHLVNCVSEDKTK